MLEGLKISERGLKSEKLPGDVRPMIIFLTDGLPSSGETNNEAIKRNIKKANKDLDIPVFSIGFGRDLDFTLIKEISEQANSFSKRIYEGSDAALQLEDFFSQISSPLISNLKFDYVGGLVLNNSVSQSSFKTFFKGGEYIIAGKLDTNSNEESLTVKVVGDTKQGPYRKDLQICLRTNKDQDEDTESSLSLIPIIPPPICLLPPSYPPRSLAQDFMQKLHAFLNIKQLIRKADLGDEAEKSENKEKALQLALDNNFVTDLTSLVVVRPDEKPTVSSLQEPHQGFGGILNQNFQPSFSSFSPGHIATRVVGGNFASKRTHNYHGLRASAPALFNSVAYTTTYRPATSTTYGPPVAAYDAYHYDYDYNYDYEEDEEPTPQPELDLPECAGKLTLFSKTYLRGEQAVVEEEESDFENISFDNLSVSASVSGSCCWQIFSGKNFTGSRLVLSSQGTYNSVSSLGQLFREVSSVRKHNCT